MALISCSNCGKEISDKAKSCPNCGYQLIEEIQQKNDIAIICEDCGREIPMDDESCPNCGCPVPNKNDDSKETMPQRVEIASVNLPNTVKKSAKKYIISAIVVIVLVVIVGSLIKSNQSAKTSENYSANLKTATAAMLLGASEAESAGNLIKSVWYNTIYEKWDYETDKYTRSNRYGFNKDFNDSLKALFSDDSFKSKISSIEINQKTVADLMKSLQNPPEEYKEAYETIKNLYTAYLDLTGIVINPSGSLQTFSNNFNNADQETLNCYNAMKLYV
jgi:RNA polymerase subunit RPABC4/transcription elongation factor Spt4